MAVFHYCYRRAAAVITVAAPAESPHSDKPRRSQILAVLFDINSKALTDALMTMLCKHCPIYFFIFSFLTLTFSGQGRNTFVENDLYLYNTIPMTLILLANRSLTSLL